MSITAEYDYVPTPTEVPHRYGNLPLSDPVTTENSAYSLREEMTTWNNYMK